MNKKINNFLILFAVVVGLIFCYVYVENLKSVAQLNYQLQYRISLEREQDALKAKIKTYQHYLPDNKNKSFPEYIEWKIRSMASDHSIDPDVAFALAVCESNLNPYAKNPSSSARGIYQFLTGTWEWIEADGSRDNAEEQVRQFMIWYPKNPQWWQECLNKI
jgi:soluble lytic murein transglycosylase-like protein